MSEPRILPTGWSVIRGKDAFSFITSGSRGWAQYYAESGPLFIRVGNFNRSSVSLDWSDRQCVKPPLGAEGLRTRTMAGDVLITITADVGMTAVVPGDLGEAYINQHVALARPVQGLSPHFLGWFIASPEGQSLLGSMDRGATKAGLGLDDIRNLSIPCAPEKEQQRIVAALDERLSELDASVASLERAERNLVRYRAAVLAAACSGTLVPTTQGCTPQPLRDLIKDLGQGWSPKCDLTKEAVPGEWAVVTTTAVQPLRYLDNQGKLLPSNLEPRPRLEILAGDFLMTRKGPRKRAGVACLVRSTRAKLMICDTVYRFRCVESAVTANYLEIALNSPAVVAAIDKQKAGISESGVSLTHDKLGEIRIPVPPLAEQERIVAEVDRHLSRADALAASIAQAKRRAQRLRRAILAAAFQGRLVPQDPHDEPASVLLDRIRAQAATAKAETASAPPRGRPPAQPAAPVAVASPPAMTPKRRGRPPGSTNKAKA